MSVCFPNRETGCKRSSIKPGHGGAGSDISPWALCRRPLRFKYAIAESERLKNTVGGRSSDIIADKSEAPVGIFEDRQENIPPINRTRNRLLVIANRDSLRHDFHHYFPDKIVERG